MAMLELDFATQKLDVLLKEESQALQKVPRQRVQYFEKYLEEVKQIQLYLEDPDGEGTDPSVAELADHAYKVGDALEILVLENKGDLKSKLACIRRQKRSKLADFDHVNITLPSGIKSRIIRSFVKDDFLCSDDKRGRQQNDKTSTTITGLDKEDDDVFVGKDDEIDLLVNRLVNGKDRLVSLCGIKGLGKTAIARKICNRREVKNHFHACASTSIPSPWDRKFTKQVLRDILTQFLPQLIPLSKKQEGMINTSKWTDHNEIVEKLLNLQTSKRCLVILDNIETMDAWDCLKHAFLTGDTASSSKMILTSPYKMVLRHVEPKGFIHQPRFMNQDESWVLFQKIASQAGIASADINNCEEMLKNIVTESYGFAPAIKEAVHSILAKVDEFKQQKIQAESLIDLKMSRQIEKAFASRYNSLSGKLKLCFLYLCSFGREFVIEVEKLQLLWIAESIIVLEDMLNSEETLMDVAERCFNELVQRAIVQVVRVDISTGQFKSCKVHQKIQSLCSKGQHTYDLESNDKQLQSDPAGQIRRLVIHMGDLKNQDRYRPPVQKRVYNTSTVIFCHKEYFQRSSVSKNVESHLTDFRKVQVLDLGGLVFSRLDKVIGTLSCLRYLGLRYTVFHKLPWAITNIKNLHTLDLSDYKRNSQYACASIPDTLSKMSCLRRLYLRSLPLSNGRVHLEGLTELEILENIDLHAFHVEELGSLTNLRRLKANIISIPDLEKIVNYLKLKDPNPKCLKYVAISIRHCDLRSEKGRELVTHLFECRVLHELSIDGRIGPLPDCTIHNNNSFPESLIKLTLESTEVTNDPMRMLKSLPKLRSLYLMWNACLVEKMVCPHDGFSQLKVLHISHAFKLKNLTVEKGGMPNLSLLKIIACTHMDAIPDGLRFLRKLEKLVIRKMPEAFTSRLKVKEDDFDQVQHLPSITIDGQKIVPKALVTEKEKTKTATSSSAKEQQPKPEGKVRYEARSMSEMLHKTEQIAYGTHQSCVTGKQPHSISDHYNNSWSINLRIKENGEPCTRKGKEKMIE